MSGKDKEAQNEQELRSLSLSVMAFSAYFLLTAKAVLAKANMSNTIYLICSFI